MVTFNSFSNILPDPAHPISDAGSLDSAGSQGPGFSAVNFQSVTSTAVSRTRSGRGSQRDGDGQYWSFSISYNPMKRDLFDPVDTFLAARNPRRDPFFVILPQYSKPKDPTFAEFARTHTITIAGTPQSGDSSFMIQHSGGSPGKGPRPGDFFNVMDPGDSNHLKAYKITMVETSNYYQAGLTPPGSNQYRIHIAPALQRNIKTANTPIRLMEPRFRVISKSDVQEHDLNTENLYSFSLAVEEIMP
jgi:hypothetical protein